MTGMTGLSKVRPSARSILSFGTLIPLFLLVHPCYCGAQSNRAPDPGTVVRAEHWLAAKIAVAGTDRQRRALIKTNKDLVDHELWVELLSISKHILLQGNPSKANSLNRLVEEFARRTGDKPALVGA
ncbi:MAG: hypothetical protein ACREAC_04270, partial [Blastocatellia bacterium]